MKKFIILGENSFVGKSLFDFLDGKEERIIVSKQVINFLEPSTFNNLNFNHATIVDCVNVNNGNEESIVNCNYKGFKDFINYLTNNSADCKYIYVSTSSVLSNYAIETNPYVRSKKMAEDLLINSGIDYQIMRLSYPIGKGENKQRLITRMIDNLKAGKKIEVNNVQLNLNDIGEVVQAMYAQIFKNRVTFISSNIYLSLVDVILFLKEKTRSTSKINVHLSTENFTPKSDSPFIPVKDIKDTLAGML